MHKIKFFKDAKSAHGKYANLTVKDNKVSLINTITGCVHPFVTGEKEITIKDKNLLTKIKQL